MLRGMILAGFVVAALNWADHGEPPRASRHARRHEERR